MSPLNHIMRLFIELRAVNRHANLTHFEGPSASIDDPVQKVVKPA